jgi:hypothetical protein
MSRLKRDTDYYTSKVIQGGSFVEERVPKPFPLLLLHCNPTLPFSSPPHFTPSYQLMVLHLKQASISKIGRFLWLACYFFLLLNLAASTVILQWEAIWATLRLSREIWRINQSCEVLTKARGNVQPLRVKPKVGTNEMLYDLVDQDVSLQKPAGTYNLCEHRQTSPKVRENIQPLWA